MVDWQIVLSSVLASIFTSSVIVAVLGYFVKKGIDRAIDFQYEKFREENRIRFEEFSRREGQIYDDQVAAFKAILPLIYRVRNTARNLQEIFNENANQDVLELNEKFRQFKGYSSAIEELLYEKRAVWAPEMFDNLHELRNITGKMLVQCERLIRDNKRGQLSAEEFQKRIARINEDVRTINYFYESLTMDIQSQIGIKKVSR